MLDLRPPVPEDTEPLARLWHDAWHDGHAAHAPPTLTRMRTLPNFRTRLGDMLAETVVCGDRGNPAGFCTVRQDELMHLFVAPWARGSTVAATLLVDGERRLRARGVDTAWLAVIIGNRRAARFYKKWGWVEMGTMTYRAETEDGALPVVEWRYEKRLGIPPSPTT